MSCSAIFKMVLIIFAVAIGGGTMASAAPVEDGAIEAPVMLGDGVSKSVAGLTSAAVDLPLPTDYCSTAVYHHNLHRMNHSAPLVVYNQGVAIYASTNIATCEVNPPEVAGSNWFMTYGWGSDNWNSASVMVAAIQAWYSESPAYSAATNGYTTAPNFASFASWGHFSQMVWHEEIAIGCWSVECGPGTAINMAHGSPDYLWQVVCASSPAGNMNGPSDYVENVTPPLGYPPSNLSIVSNKPCSTS